MMVAIALASLIALLNALPSSALDFTFSSQKKCVYEELNAHMLAVGEYQVFYTSAGPDKPEFASVEVLGPHGHVVYKAEHQHSGEFAFTSATAGEYTACFTAPEEWMAPQLTLRLDWKLGVAATDWSSIAKKEHLDDLGVELRRLDDSIREVYNDLILLQQREQEMRDISETTNFRVAWYSIFSLFVCVACGLVQLLYLRRFFTKKKLM
eukprot:gene13971-19914_t